MDVSNRRHKRKHPDSNPQDQFGGGTPSVLGESSHNGVGVHPRTKRRRMVGKHSEQELKESTTQKALHEAVGTARTGTKSQGHGTVGTVSTGTESHGTVSTGTESHGTVGRVSTGTMSQGHRTEKQYKKKKSVSHLQVKVENLINSNVQSALSQEGGSCYGDENITFEQKSEEPLQQNGAQGAQNSKRRKSRKKKKVLKNQRSGVGREVALQYLHLWEDERSSWCFKKKAQFWLLQNMYEEDQVPKSEFKILLRYLEGLQGNQRQLAMEKSQEVLEGYEGDGSKVPKKRYRRAVAILRRLA